MTAFIIVVKDRDTVSNMIYQFDHSRLRSYSDIFETEAGGLAPRTTICNIADTYETGGRFHA